MNITGMTAIYRYEMARFGRTFWTSLILPVLTTILYFVVFGSAVGSRMENIGGVSYGAFIVPGLMMLTMFTESLNNASFGIYLPKWTGSLYEHLSAPLGPAELVAAFVGAAASKSVVIGAIIFATAHLFVDVTVAYPLLMVAYLLLVVVTFCLFGFAIGIWAKSFEQLQVVPLLIVYPLTFLGGAFYSIDMLPPLFRTISLFNPVVYLMSGFRWTFFGVGDVPVLVSLAATLGFFALCLGVVLWMFRTGYKIRS